MKGGKTDSVSEDKRKIVIEDFYYIYRRLQKRYSLRMHSHFSIYGEGLIEIWEYQGDTRKRAICRIKEEDEVEHYKKAIQELKNFEQYRSS